MRQARTSTDRRERRRFLRNAFGCFVVAVGATSARVGHGQAPLFLGVTTSVENSGLLAHIVDRFNIENDIPIRAVTAGSGAVMNLAARGDVDLILVHSPEDERAFVAEGKGIDRRPVMRNRFVIVGPRSDPAGIRQASDAKAALASIAADGALFLSRGDESGTHKAELRLWQQAGIDPAVAGEGWYRESGSGQGATLNIAANTGAYTLTDEATWTTFGNPGHLETLFAGDDPMLDNLYSVIRVNPARHRGLNVDGALAFANWLTSKAGQAAISSFKAGGRPLFQAVYRLAG